MVDYGTARVPEGTLDGEPYGGYAVGLNECVDCGNVYGIGGPDPNVGAQQHKTTDAHKLATHYK